MRQSPGRNQRSGRWKVKHVLQICVLVAVCVWLAYQVKHSQDQRKALEEGSSKPSGRAEADGANLLKLGRKDPHGNVVIIDTENSSRRGEEETREAEEAAAAAAAAERENKREGGEEEGRGSGGNETAGNDRERAGEGAEHGEESGDGVAKGEERPGDAGSSDNQDHEGADTDGSSQEAREEHYRADDASSAVVRDTHEMDQENGNLSAENSEERKVEEEVLGNGGTTDVTADAAKDGRVHDDPVDGESQQPNTSSSESVIEAYNDTTSSYDDQMQQQNNLTDAAPDEQVETQSTSAGVDAETVNSFENAAAVDMASALDQNAVNEGRTLGNGNPNLENDSTTFEHDDQIEQQSNSTETVSDGQVETRGTSEGVHGETVDSSSENVTVDTVSARDQSAVNEATTVAEDNSNTGDTPLEQTEKSDPNGGDGSDESQQASASTDGNGDVVQGDLSTLPESETKKSGEGIAAE